MKNKYLNTDVIPKFNCSNCEFFIYENIKKVVTNDTVYAIECSNVVHPTYITKICRNRRT